MGQQSLSAGSELGFQMSNWVQAVEDSSTSRFVNINPYRKRLLMNKLTSQLIEEYELQFFNQQDFNSFLAQLQLRRQQGPHKMTSSNRSDQQLRNCPYIYKIMHFQNMSVKEMCSTIYDGLLYIEKVDLRLKEVNDIPFQDELYLLNACLHGFKILYEKVGVFEINQEMIFFNQQGEVKVWMNPNLSSFQPNYQPEYYNSLDYNEAQGSQTDMLRNLIKIIEENTDGQAMAQNLQFKDYIFQKGLFDRLSFSKAIEYFRTYCQENRFHLPTHMSSIYQLFHYDQVASRQQQMQTSEVGKVNFNHHFDINKTNHISHDHQPGSNNSSEKQMPLGRQQNRGELIGQQSRSHIHSEQQVKREGKLSGFLQRSRESKNSNQSYQENKNKNGGKQRHQSNMVIGQGNFIYNNQKHINNQYIKIHIDKPTKHLPSQQFHHLPPHSENFNQNSSIYRKQTQSKQTITFKHPEMGQSIGPAPQSHKTAPVAHLTIPSSTSITRYKSLEKSQNNNTINHSPNMNAKTHTTITFNYKVSPTPTPPIMITPSKNTTNPLIKQPVHKYNEAQQLYNKKRKESIIDKLSSPFNNPISSMQAFSSQATKLNFYHPPTQLLSNTQPPKYNYYSSTSEYTLDNQIANDMAKYLGYNPNNL